MLSADSGGLPPDAEGAEELAEMALDLRNCWDHRTDRLWSRLEPELWALTHNPWVVLQTASGTKLKRLLTDPAYRKDLHELLADRKRRESELPWFERTHANSGLKSVAYFSMEFGLSEALPIYSGGLGNVAGDQLKAASDLGVPLIAVGLAIPSRLFSPGHPGGRNQHALYPYNDPGQMPMTPVRDSDGEWMQIERANARTVNCGCATWQAQVGRLKLYLLDSNDPANPPADRGITSQLYGGGPELRLAQELVLGHRRLAALAKSRHQSGSLPSERGTCGLCRAGAGAEFHGGQRTAFRGGAGGHASRQSVYDSYSGGSGVRPFCAKLDEPVPRAIRARAAQHRSLTICWRWAVRDLTTRANPLIWLTWRSAAAGRSTESAACMARSAAESFRVFSRAGRKQRFRWDTSPTAYTRRPGIPRPPILYGRKPAAATVGAEAWKPSKMPSAARPTARCGSFARRTVSSWCTSYESAWPSRLPLAAKNRKPAESVFDPDTLTLGFARRFATYKRPNLLPA